VPGMGAHGLVAGICQPLEQCSIWELAGHSGSPWISQAASSHVNEAAPNFLN